MKERYEVLKEKYETVMDKFVNSIKDYEGQITKLKESQKQLAISELLKVYQIVKYYNSEVNKFGNYINTLNIEQYINDQIKALKGEKC